MMIGELLAVGEDSGEGNGKRSKCSGVKAGCFAKSQIHRSPLGWQDSLLLLLECIMILAMQFWAQ